MNNKLLNVLWLIIVSLLTNNLNSQIVVDPNNRVELRISCDQLGEILAPMVSSNCKGEINFNYEDKLYSGGCMGTIERIWTIRDECNNTTTFQQFIRMDDKIRPKLSVYPKDIAVSIDEIPVQPEIYASDNCSEKLKVSFREEKVNDENGNLHSIIRRWSVRDKCSNLEEHMQVISIKNEIP